MDFEIDFQPVGDASRAGDAIVIRYGFPGDYRVMIVDGGTDSVGDDVVRLIKGTFGPYTVVSDVVSTHPDTDHSCGIRTIIRELPVERLWAHGLWHHATEMLDLFEGRWSADGLANSIRREYPVIEELFELAAERGTAIYEPFAGQTIGPFTVLSPSYPNYLHLVPQFRKTPAPNMELLKARGIWLGAPKGAFYGAAAAIRSAFDALVSWIPESWAVERLQEGGITAAENETSTVMLGVFDHNKVLLTGDAGCNGLWWAADNAPIFGLSLDGLSLIQVPHHGSRSNVSPSILNRLIGLPIPFGSPEKMRAIASVPADDTKHPRKMVVNAFTRRGAGVRKTAGENYRYSRGMPQRSDEGPVYPYPFFAQVEDYD